MNITLNNPFKRIPKIIFFDLCGTILDSKQLDHEAINYTLGKFNKSPWNIMRAKKDPAKSMKENFPNFFEEDADKAYDTYINHLISNINNIPIFDNVYEHLNILKVQSVIITNRDKTFVDALVSSKNFQNINSHIDLIISADDVGITKPSCKIIDYALDLLKQPDVNKEEIIFIGDALADMNTAISYNCIPVLLTTSTSDITQNFLIENNSKIYTATSYKEINRCLIETYTKKYLNNEIGLIDYYNKNLNSK